MYSYLITKKTAYMRRFFFWHSGDYRRIGMMT